MQITRKVSQVESFLLTRLYSLVDAKIYKGNEQIASFFEKYSFIASKPTFEFISRYKDVQESHLKENKQVLEQTQATGLNGTPLPPADKT